MKDVKILVVYHKDAPPSNSLYLPIHVGEGGQGGLRDDTGDNISSKNAVYNELTAIYWAWRHYEEIGSPDYIGLCHYRRFFIFEERKYPYYESEGISLDKPEYGLEKLSALLENYDCLAPMRTKRASVGGSYAKAHRKEDLDLLLELISTYYPEYTEIANEYLESNGIYYYNMFVLPKAKFFDYAEWLFKIIDAFVSRSAIQNERLFISEILTGIYLYSLKKNGERFVEIPIDFVAGKRQKFKEAWFETKDNLKKKKSGFVYSFRPLILWFAPKKLMLLRRRRKVKDK